jgi:5-methylcytosine-specific restriction protein A
MASRPPRVCDYPGCPRTTHARFCPQHAQQHAATQRERERQRSADRRRSTTVRRHVAERDGPRCRRCGITGVPMQRHHVVPLAQGGPDIEANMVMLCVDCHQQLHREPRR